MNMKKRFRIAGCFSIANAVLSLPLFVASVLTGVAEATGTISGLTSRIITSVMSILMYPIAIYILVALRKLFEQRYGYRGVSRILTTFIYISGVLMVASALGVISSATEAAAAILSVIGLIVMGIMSVVYGIKLLSFDQELYGFRKLYAGTSIAAGVCYATVLLIPLGLLVGIASNIILAIIFFREAEMATDHESRNP
jgi:hypothetical protein